MMYLHESDVSCKALAIDLCSRGFAVWQHYIDAMEMLRSLFNLATSSKKESITAQNIGPQARQAVLQVVTNDTGLFMTTLSLDILHPQSLEHRKSVLQLVAFLTRKVCHIQNKIYALSSVADVRVETPRHLSSSSQACGSSCEISGPQFHLKPRRGPRLGNRDPRPCRENVHSRFTH